MKRIEVKYTPSVSDVKVGSPLSKFWEWEFLKLARQYKYHTCEEKGCMVCEALEIIDAGRTELALQATGIEIEANF